MGTKKAITIGASSGIGYELAKILSHEGYEVGLAARRKYLLDELSAQLPTKSYSVMMDISDTQNAMSILSDLIQTMETVDLIVVSAGIGFVNPDLDWVKEKETIETNVLGFTAVVNVALHYFMHRTHGHLAAISSIAGIRGSNDAPAYAASKAFISNYLEGIRKKIIQAKLDITITDLQPGFVDTKMAKMDPHEKFWMSSAQEAASQIFQALKTKQKHAYITRRWRLVAWFLKLVPNYIYNKL